MSVSDKQFDMLVIIVSLIFCVIMYFYLAIFQLSSSFTKLITSKLESVSFHLICFYVYLLPCFSVGCIEFNAYALFCYCVGVLSKCVSMIIFWYD